MSTSTFGPTPSQTVGPYLRIGMEWLHRPDLTRAGDTGTVVLSGRVLDGDGAAVPDAVIELWQPDTGGFGRYLVDEDGSYRFRLAHSSPVDVTIFARGLLNRLVTRLAFADDPGRLEDPILALVPPERLDALLAEADGAGGYRWDVHLQGPGETPFLVW